MKRDAFYHELFTDGVITSDRISDVQFNEDTSGNAYRGPVGTYRIAKDSIQKNEIDSVMLLQLKRDVKIIKYVCVGFATAAAIGIIMNIVYLSKIAGAFAELM